MRTLLFLIGALCASLSAVAQIGSDFTYKGLRFGMTRDQLDSLVSSSPWDYADEIFNLDPRFVHIVVDSTEPWSRIDTLSWGRFAKAMIVVGPEGASSFSFYSRDFDIAEWLDCRWTLGAAMRMVARRCGRPTRRVEALEMLDELDMELIAVNGERRMVGSWQTATGRGTRRVVHSEIEVFFAGNTATRTSVNVGMSVFDYDR